MAKLDDREIRSRMIPKFSTQPLTGSELSRQKLNLMIYNLFTYWAREEMSINKLTLA